MYWERDQEITLLWIVLEALDSKVDRGAADQIVSGLIEMGLADMDRAPVAQQKWNDEWNGYEVTRDFIARWYLTEDEIIDEQENDEDYEDDA